MSVSPPPVVAIMGPTAAGKSDLAVQLARALGGEVVNGDSMQLYRGMDIGTAKLPVMERAGVPHHLLDVLDVGEPATVRQFQMWARHAIVDCLARGRTAIVVGGSALYLRAVLDQLDFPATDAGLRADLEQQLERNGPAALYQELQHRDPGAASVIAASNGRRIVRALEVNVLTGQPFRANLPPPVHAFDTVVQLGLAVPRDVLDQRIGARVDHMWRQGLVDEVRGLELIGLREGRTASRALGYRQVLAMLAGECDETQARDVTVRATRKFARRQGAWFRRDARIRWSQFDAPDLLAQAVHAVRSML
ncbi:MAG: tRNA (adenosine(37)-N6)-dimethylallyltransferase MiaA [Nocardioidaceae bacterium]